MPVRTWIARVDTPSGRKSYRVYAQDEHSAIEDITAFLAVAGVPDWRILEAIPA